MPFALSEVGDFVCSAIFQRVSGYAHIGNSAARKNCAFHVVGIAFPGDFFDDAAQHAVAEV